jgi:hypothetical protein
MPEFWGDRVAMSRDDRSSRPILLPNDSNFLREVVRALRGSAISAKAGNPVTLWDMREIEAAAGPLGLTVVTVEIRRMEDVAPGFEAFKARADLFRPIRS